MDVMAEDFNTVVLTCLFCGNTSPCGCKAEALLREWVMLSKRPRYKEQKTCKEITQSQW